MSPPPKRRRTPPGVENKPPTLAQAEKDAWIAQAERDREHAALFRVERQLSEIELNLSGLELKEAERLEKDLSVGADQDRVYTFYGEVEPEIVQNCMEELAHWSRRDPKKPITIILNSCGGYCIDGIALYDFLMHLRAEEHYITIVALGEASSMGGIILQAADWRVMGSTSELLIHEVAAEQIGSRTVTWIEDRSAYLRKLNRRMDEILADRSKMTLKEIEKRQKNKDWFLDAHEALELGFIDEVR